MNLPRIKRDVGKPIDASHNIDIFEGLRCNSENCDEESEVVVVRKMDFMDKTYDAPYCKECAEELVNQDA